MENETVNQETAPETKPEENPAEAGGTPAPEPARSFTQAEVDAIVGERLTRERAKFADYADLKKAAEELTQSRAELQTAKDEAAKLQKQVDDLNRDIQIRNAREKASAAKGVPASLLKGTTEEECMKEADDLIKWRGTTPNYPESKDGGAVTDFSGGKTRDQFAAFVEANLS